MPRIHPVQGGTVHRSPAPTAGDVAHATRRRTPKSNSKSGLDIAASAAPTATATSAPAGRFIFEKHDPVTGPHIVSKPGDEPPLPLELKITRVYDGDTLVGTDAKGVEYHVRVQNMNTTELKPHEEGADEGKAATEKLVLGKTVKLVYDKDRPKDGYNRILAQVMYKDDKGWVDLAHTVIRQGWAHLFIVSEVGNPANLKELLEDEAKARKDGLGLWKLPRFKGADFAVTSFHANGNGNEKEYPNAEYLRIANITGQPLELADYTLSTEQGKKFHLPKGTLKPGHTVQIFTGEGTNVVDSQAATKVFLGSTTPIWDNVKCTATITAKGGRVAAERIHEAKTPMRDIAKLPDPVSQMTLAGLGQDVEMKYIFPKRIDLTRAKGDDGDTTFILSPADGVIKVDIEDPRTGKTLRRSVHIGDQKESPPGYLAVRYFGIDTPETHLEVDQPDGTTIAYSQGKPGEIAAEEVEKLLSKATAAHILPIGFDVYGRLLGMVIAKMPDGKEINVNEWVARQGLGEMAMYYKTGAWDPKLYGTFQAASKNAFENKLGIYSKGPGGCPERPVEMRRRVRHVATKPPYVIDMETKVVYNGADIAKVTPWKRLFVFDNALRPAVKELGLKLGPGVTG